MITYRVWYRERYLSRLIRTTTSTEEVLRVVEVYGGKNEYVFVTMTWYQRTFFLLNSLDGKISMTDYRQAVAKLLRSKRR